MIVADRIGGILSVACHWPEAAFNCGCSACVEALLFHPLTAHLPITESNPAGVDRRTFVKTLLAAGVGLTLGAVPLVLAQVDANP